VTDAHTLVVLIRHVASRFDRPADELADVWRIVGQVGADLARSLDPDGITTGVSGGQAAGQTAAHAHVLSQPWQRPAVRVRIVDVTG
jgi:diadenosine tetraphosphate (Ap4A) HIT family hydrolase